MAVTYRTDEAAEELTRNGFPPVMVQDALGAGGDVDGEELEVIRHRLLGLEEPGAFRVVEANTVTDRSFMAAGDRFVRADGLARRILWVDTNWTMSEMQVVTVCNGRCGLVKPGGAPDHSDHNMYWEERRLHHRDRKVLQDALGAAWRAWYDSRQA
jgi:hypothetical protein